MERAQLIAVIIIGIIVLMTLILTVLYYTNRDMKWRIERLLLVFYN